MADYAVYGGNITPKPNVEYKHKPSLEQTEVNKKQFVDFLHKKTKKIRVSPKTTILPPTNKLAEPAKAEKVGGRPSVSTLKDQPTFKPSEREVQDKVKTYQNTPSPKKSLNDTLESTEIGTKLALEKELRRYSRELEQYLIASMWEFAYKAAKDPNNEGIADNLYGGQYIRRMVQDAYGENGGPFSEAIYEKLVLEQGVDFEE